MSIQRHVSQNDIRRQKQNQIYDRQLKIFLNGRNGLNWRLHYNLEQIRHDERQLDRTLGKLPQIAKIKKTSIESNEKQTITTNSTTTDDYLSSMLINLRSNQSTSIEKLSPTNRYVPPYKRLFWFDYYQHQQMLNLSDREKVQKNVDVHCPTLKKSNFI